MLLFRSRLVLSLIPVSSHPCLILMFPSTSRDLNLLLTYIPHLTVPQGHKTFAEALKSHLEISFSQPSVNECICIGSILIPFFQEQIVLG